MLTTIKHLFPRNARAFQATIDKRWRQTLAAIGQWTGVINNDLAQTYTDLLPEHTTKLTEWEQEFALPDAVLTEQQRRDRLTGAWRAQGGQSPAYIQSVLRAAGFDVYVHEFWESRNPTVVRNPNTYLRTAVNQAVTGMGTATTTMGAPEATMGATRQSIANRPAVAAMGHFQTTMNSGRATMGASGGLIGYLLDNGRFDDSIAAIPSDPNEWRFIFYIAGRTFPTAGSVPLSRKLEFETLLLKIKPAQQWTGIIVEFT